MSYFVVVPGALVPASLAPALVARSNVGTLDRRLRRALPGAATIGSVATEGAAHLGWLWSRFGGTDDPPVTAPYVRRALYPAVVPADPLPVWHLDPVHFAFARDHMLVCPLDDDPPDAAERGELLAQAREAAAEFGAAVQAIEGHWFITFDPPWSLQAVPLCAAWGGSVFRLLPAGDDAARWRKLMTEIQIRWAQLGLNGTREAAGRKTVNGLWLHGGGVYAELPKRPFSAVAGSDPVVRGWALASGVAPAALAAGTTPTSNRAVLEVWPGLQAPCALEAWDDWCEGLARLERDLETRCRQALAAGNGSVTLVPAGRHFVRPIELRGGDRLCFWRRAALAELLAEPDPA